MAYARWDFSESLERVDVDPTSIAQVYAAWGRSSEDDGEWSGGFLLDLKDGRFAYVSGWCDTSGWGCQDGAEVVYFEARPSLEGLEQCAEWDVSPADLNLWLVAGARADEVHV